MDCVRRRSGFTLIELLVVFAIIAALSAILGIVALRMRETARIARAKALVKRIHIAVDKYWVINREYPPVGKDYYPDTVSNAPLPGVQLDKRWLPDYDTTFKGDELDPADKNYIVDPWGVRIRYRKAAEKRILIWSAGPDKTDQTGDVTKNTKKLERITKGVYTTPAGKDSTLTYDAQGGVYDDITNLESDL